MTVVVIVTLNHYGDVDGVDDYLDSIKIVNAYLLFKYHLKIPSKQFYWCLLFTILSK